MRRNTRMPHNVLKSVNTRLPSSYTRYRLQPHSLPQENSNPITVQRPRRGVQLENGNRHRNLSKNSAYVSSCDDFSSLVWKPQAYSLPRILIFLQMLTGLILLGTYFWVGEVNDSTGHSRMYLQRSDKLQLLSGAVYICLSKRL